MRFLSRSAEVVRKALKPFHLSVIRLPAPNTLEHHLSEMLRALRVDTVIDVGAHWGEYRGLLRRIGFAGRIISFEPVASSFDILASNSRDDAA